MSKEHSIIPLCSTWKKWTFVFRTVSPEYHSFQYHVKFQKLRIVTFNTKPTKILQYHVVVQIDVNFLMMHFQCIARLSSAQAAHFKLNFRFSRTYDLNKFNSTEKVSMSTSIVDEFSSVLPVVLFVNYVYHFVRFTRSPRPKSKVLLRKRPSASHTELFKQWLSFTTSWMQPGIAKVLMLNRSANYLHPSRTRHGYL